MSYPNLNSDFLIMGVDPGLSGAVAFYNFKTKELDSVFDMPLYKGSKDQKPRIDTFILSSIIGRKAKDTRLCVIEEVGAMPNQGVSSTFKFGYVTGVVTGVVAAYNIPTIQVSPSVWKIASGLSKDKKVSRLKAINLFPGFSTKFMRAKDDGRAEAAMLAYFGERFI